MLPKNLQRYPFGDKQPRAYYGYLIQHHRIKRKQWKPAKDEGQSLLYSILLPSRDESALPTWHQ